MDALKKNWDSIFSIFNNGQSIKRPNNKKGLKSIKSRSVKKIAKLNKTTKKIKKLVLTHGDYNRRNTPSYFLQETTLKKFEIHLLIFYKKRL